LQLVATAGDGAFLSSMSVCQMTFHTDTSARRQDCPTQVPHEPLKPKQRLEGRRVVAGTTTAANPAGGDNVASAAGFNLASDGPLAS